jgi:hypothetical protein
VFRNGGLRLTDVVTDAACIADGLLRGAGGVPLIRAGLLSQASEGVSTFDPHVRTAELRQRTTRLCGPEGGSTSMWITDMPLDDLLDLTTATEAQARSVRVAPLGAGGRAVRAARADASAPRTTVTVRRRGATARLRFRVRDRSPVARLDVTLDGRRARVGRGVARVPARSLRRVRFRAIDVFGNAERLRRP